MTAPLPGLLPGDYFVIVRSDIRNQIPENSEENNIGGSLDEVAIGTELLELGVGDTGTLAEGQSVYYQVQVEAGETLLVNFDSVSETAANELYIRYNEIPSRNQFDLRFSEEFAPDQEIVVSNTLAGTYHILAYGDRVPEETEYTVSADIIDFSILSIGPDFGSNLGNATITLLGAEFTPNTEVQLIAADGSEFTATNVIWKDDTELWATLDLQGLETGLYDVQIEDGGETAALEDSFTVTNGPIGDLEVELVNPAAVRSGQQGVITVVYTNMGETDVIAPLINLSIENAQMRLPSVTEFSSDDLQLLGINTDGPAGILAPGDSDSISVIFRPTGGDISFSVGEPIGDGTIDWDAIEAEAQPIGVSPEAWDVIWENYKTSVGNTPESYNAVLAEMATFLSQLGVETQGDVNILRSQLQQVSGYGILFSQYHLGSFGRGIAFLGDLRAFEDDEDNAIIEDSGRQRIFQRLDDDTYAALPGDYATLTRIDDTFQLT